MSELEAIISAVLAFALVIAFAGLYYVSGRYVIRLHIALRGAVRELAEVRVERDEAVRALERATGGTEDIMRAVRGEVPRG